MISTDNAQGELYLTDAVGVLAEAGHSVQPLLADAVEISGVNDRAQLADVTEQLAARIAQIHMQNGVTIVQPSSTVIDAKVAIEPDVTIHASTILEGTTYIATGAVVGPNSHLVDATIGERSRIASSTVQGAAVGADQTVGPFEHVTSDRGVN